MSGIFAPSSLYSLINEGAWGSPDQPRGFIHYFSACLGTQLFIGPEIPFSEEKETNPSGAIKASRLTRAWKLSDLFRLGGESHSPAAGISSVSDEPDYDQRLLEALSGLPAEILQDAALLFDHGSEVSLGFFDDLQSAGLYIDLYKFFIEARIALEQDKIRSRYTR